MKQLGLTAWGGICIFAGLMSQLIMGLIKPPTNRAEMLGQGMAVMLSLIVGVILIGIGLAQNKQRR